MTTPKVYSGSPSTSRIGQTTGDIYYVNQLGGSDTNSGLSTYDPLKTIEAATPKLVKGDCIKLAAGTYTGLGLELSVDGCDIHCDLGSIIAPASGTGIVLSGNYCCLCGPVTIMPAADEIGVDITGTGCYAGDTIVLGSDSSTGIRAGGTVNDLFNCKIAGIKASGKGIEINGDKITAKECGVAGENASYGIYINNSSDFGILDRCFTIGCGLGGYHLASGVAGWTIKDCNSGIGDGKSRDIDLANEWSNFTFHDIATSVASIDASNETKSYNVAQIYGSIVLSKIRIDILVALSSNITDFYLDIWDGSVSVPISKVTTLDLSSAPAGSLITRNADSDVVLDYQSGATAYKSENTSYREPQTEVIVGQKGDGTDTFLRMTYTTTNTPSLGTLRNYLEWSPVTDDGFLEVL